MVSLKLFGKKLKAEAGVYGNFIEIPILRKNQFLVLKSLTFGEMVCFKLFGKKLKTESGIYGNSVKIPIIRKNQ